MKDLTGRTVLVTGGASGIGLGMARAFVGAGAKVALVDIDEAALAIAAEDLRRAGGEVLPLALDTTDLERWREVVAQTCADLGPLAVLCNNAGVGGTHERVADSDPKRWARVIEINLLGYYYGCVTALPGMLERQDEGHVINVASVSGLCANPVGSAYSASKYAVVGLSDSLRGELKGSRIGISVVYPGATSTNLSANTIKLNGRAGGEPPGRAAITALLAQGTNPDDLGARVVQAVLANEYHVFTHLDLGPDVEAIFNERLAPFRAAGTIPA